MRLTPDEAFARDIPADQQEDVLTRIVEAIHNEDHGDKDIDILNRDHLDVINVRAEGIIRVGGSEHCFIIQDGNRNGTEIEDWDGDKEFAPLPRTEWVLAPTNDRVNDAVLSGSGPNLIKKWDILAARSDISDIVRSYAYDRYFQPGGLIEKHYRDKASKHGFQIVSSEHADEIRKRLSEATTDRRAEVAALVSALEADAQAESRDGAPCA